MTTISIKDVPEAWASVLRDRAARNHRSLQGELTAILEAAVRADVGAAKPPGGLYSPDFAGRTESLTLTPGKKRIELIAREHRERFPQPILKGPLAVDIVRQDRDAR